jgi:nucleotide-binding universal stress UspA family protein
MNKILVPTDFGPEAEKAYEVARVVAEKQKAKIVLFHILPTKLKLLTAISNGLVGVTQNTDLEEEIELANEKLDKIVKSRVFGYINVETEILKGENDIVDDVLEFFKKDNHDLVIMGTAGEDKKGESNAEIIARRSTIPVITVHKNQGEDFQIDHVVLPTDLKTLNRKFISNVNTLRTAFNSKLTVLFINSPKNFKETDYINREWSLFKSRYDVGDADFVTYNAFDIESGINKFSTKNKAKMIFIPTHGRTGIDRLFTTSYVEDIINHSDIPVYSYNLNNDLENLPDGKASGWSSGFTG